MTEIAANDDNFIPTCAAVEVLINLFFLVNPVRVSIIIMQRVMNGLDTTG